MSKKREIEKSEDDWKKALTPEQYRIMREKGTERAFTGAYVDNHDKGMYRCAACHGLPRGAEHESSSHHERG